VPTPPPSIPLPELRRRFRERPASLLGCIPGIFLIDKPEGMTSHDVVAVARRRLGLRRVGHGGTLDPMATGLLVVFAGNATRLFDELQTFPKAYEAELRLGVTTETQDRTGAVVAERPVPPLADDAMEAALDRFRGAIQQTPPMYSALKKDGRPLYEYAREGKTVHREPRTVTVHALALAGRQGGTLRLAMTVSKGFYVRTLVHDLGEALGCGATMTALRRTRIGPFSVADAVAPDALLPPPEAADD